MKRWHEWQISYTFKEECGESKTKKIIVLTLAFKAEINALDAFGAREGDRYFYK